MSTSVIDYIFRELAVTYLGRNDLAHVEPDEIKSKASAGIVKKLNEPDFIEEEIVGERLIELDKDSDDYDFTSSATVKPTTIKHNAKNGNNDMSAKIRQAIERGYTGDICTECQSMTMVRNGTCLKCMTCGSTSGCS